jgi:hypothetical protein
MMPDGANADEMIQALLDRDAIRDLPIRYCDHVWRNEPDRMVELFADDCLFDDSAAWSLCTGTGRVVGKAALLLAYRRSMGDQPSKPFIHNHVVRLERRDRATGTCYVDLRMAHNRAAHPIIGWYDDVYVKVGERWLFAERHATLLGEPPG